jgi:hypothetical protein
MIRIKISEELLEVLRDSFEVPYSIFNIINLNNIILSINNYSLLIKVIESSRRGGKTAISELMKYKWPKT